MSPCTHCKQHSSVYVKKHTLHSPAAQSNKHELQTMCLEHGACIKFQNCRECSSCSRITACSSTCDPCLHQSSSKPRYELHDISRSSRPSGLLPCFSFFFPAILVCFFSSAKDTAIIPYATPQLSIHRRVSCNATACTAVDGYTSYVGRQQCSYTI